MTQLVLLGGGHAHLQVLHGLAQQPLERTQVTLVSPFPQLVYSGMVPGWLAGHCHSADCTIALGPLAARGGVRFVQAAAVSLDPAVRRLRLDDGREIGYDVLSVDIGSAMDREAIPGASEHGLFVRPMEHFMERAQAVLARAGPSVRDAVVVGGGAAGVELALALRYRLGAAARIGLVTGGPPVLEAYPAAARRLGLRALKRCGVALFEQSCRRVAADHVTLDNGERLPCDLAVLAIGASAPGWLGSSGLALDERGFIATGPTLQSTSHGEVFAAGDVASRIDAPRPRSGVYAVRAGPPLALNLRRFIAGAPLQHYVPQTRSLNLLACGDKRAIVSWGRFAAEGRWAWRWKDRIDRRFVGQFTEGLR